MFRKNLYQSENCRSDSTDQSKHKFVDLTPVLNADSDGHYTSALLYAMGNDRIKNFAITGPYGSGKSSIISTFEKNHKEYKFLNISLASFDEESDENPTPTENRLIERSILQQMLYGADANKLPYSRFKRISSPEYPKIKSAFIGLWVILAALLTQEPSLVFSSEPYTPLFFAAVLMVSFLIALPILVGADLYKSSFGISFKKLSLTNAEFELGDVSEHSILNKHLDEIIYFFQATEYNVVVIEDLDRFGSPEIFVKLREINKLINDNEKTKGIIKFLYALKDDMFTNEHRAKFFDFIIPVVPIINNSNSLDKMQERLNALNLSNINDQFLREVSLYINDLRLLNNIFNEFSIYNAKLNSEKLDKTKLLAMMIYKNVYPSDFEALHNSKGVLFTVCKYRNELVRKTRVDLSNEIKKIREVVKKSQDQTLKEATDLVKVFIGHIITTASSYTNNPVVGIFTNGHHKSFDELLEWDEFENLFSDSNLHLSVDNSRAYGRLQALGTGKSFKELEREITPEASFSEKKDNIDNAESSVRKEMLAEIHQKEVERTNIASVPLHKLLQLQGSEYLNELIKKEDINEPQLLNYLISEGYIDDNFSLYISNFHEGRLTAQDRDFLLTIRSYRRPDSLQPIDNPAEICANMRPEDFSQPYVLNVFLFDYLLENTTRHSKNLQTGISFIARNFSESEEFLAAYWTNGKDIKQFVNLICEQWPGYALEAIGSHRAADHVALIINYADHSILVDKMNLEGKITGYINKNVSMIIESEIASLEDYSILRKLNVRLESLDSIREHRALLDFAHLENIYEISPENIGLILEIYSKAPSSDISTKNYSVIHEYGSDNLKAYVNARLDKYISEVFLALPDNTQESGESIKILLNEKSIANTNKEKIIIKQDYIFESFDGIPKAYWKALFINRKIQISWKNISDFLSAFQEEEGNDFLTKLLNETDVCDELEGSQIKAAGLSEENSKKLSRFIYENSELDPANYDRLLPSLAWIYRDFPADIGQQKCLSLAKHRVVRLNEDSFSTATDNVLTELISKNFVKYKENVELYQLDENTCMDLLYRDDLDVNSKLFIAKKISAETINGDENAADILSELLIAGGGSFEEYGLDFLEAVITGTTQTESSIRLLSHVIALFGKQRTIDVLLKLEKPYKDIGNFGKRPKFPINETTQFFAEQLVENGVVSKKVEEGDKIRIITFSKRW